MAEVPDIEKVKGGGREGVRRCDGGKVRRFREWETRDSRVCETGRRGDQRTKRQRAGVRRGGRKTARGEAEGKLRV